MGNCLTCARNEIKQNVVFAVFHVINPYVISGVIEQEITISKPLYQNAKKLKHFITVTLNNDESYYKNKHFYIKISFNKKNHKHCIKYTIKAN